MNINPEVDLWLEAYDNPMKPVVAAIRQLALSCDPRIDECIKWQAPTFMYKGNIASFFPRAKKHASLMFHKGAEIAGDVQNLQGDGKEARSFKVFDLPDLEAKSAELTAIFRAWCDMKDADT
ncbi:MAG: DUF1801 domain-containing protein [Alphaproteobacteria bacterium]|nr:DUF1801 domain-containing protein [Alphaproteobacteria bacterium]